MVSLICWITFSIIICWIPVWKQTISYGLPLILRMIFTWSVKVLFRSKRKSGVWIRRNLWHIFGRKLQEREYIICCWMKFRCWIVLRLFWMDTFAKRILMCLWREVTQNCCQRILLRNLQAEVMKFICTLSASLNLCLFITEINIPGYLNICFTVEFH